MAKDNTIIKCVWFAVKLDRQTFWLMEKIGP